MGGVNSDVVAFGSVRGGRIHFADRRNFDRQIAQFKDGATVQVEVTIRRATRGIPQNAWYWGVALQLLSEHTGYTPDELHEFLKAKFIPKKLAVCDGNGEVQDEYVIGGSTRKMTTVEFSAYGEAIQQWASETLDCVIPSPNEEMSHAL